MIGINEVAQKVIEKPQSSFDPSKRVSEVNSETKKIEYKKNSKNNYILQCSSNATS